ncbi:MAG: hypothetical protein LBD43_00425, partial [Holosporales bacterium]|nr:hypothetical protein [Holosporales bacterium]
MVVRKSHFLSISLLATASAIAIVEYVLVSHETVVDFPDEDVEPSDEVTDDVGVPAENTKPAGEEYTGPIAKPYPQTQVIVPNDTSDDDMPGERKIVVQSGDSIATILEGIKVHRTEVHMISKALSKIFNLKSLKTGQEISIRGHADANSIGMFCVDMMEIRNAYDLKIVVERVGPGYKARKETIPVKKVIRSVTGVITPHDPNTSLKRSGVKPQIARDVMKSLAQVVNIRSAKSAVNFEFLYQDFYMEDGSVARSPELVYASVLINGKIIRLYKFAHGNRSEYVDQNGNLVRTLASTSSMLLPPLAHMKVTSPFGMRRNPKNGHIKLHTGVDLSAVVGTPVRA